MSALVLAGVEIHQDAEGRFSLNDFHRAAGGEARHKPSEWARLQQSQELIDELTKAGITALRTARGGAAPGTYVCKELVYSYAMWVSPAFSLKVIRTFDAVVNPAANDPAIPVELQLTVAADSFGAARRIVQGFGLAGNQATISANRMVKQTIGLDLMELAGVQRLVNESQELNYTPTELGTRFGMGARDIKKLLAECGLQRSVEYAKGKKRWELLPEGKPFAVITDTPKRHSDGKPVQQILWKESVLGELRRLAQRLQAELPKRASGVV